MIYAVIMAGGSGTRFWPKSTNEQPKQFQNLFGDKTMLQSTVKRLEGFVPPEACMVVTSHRHVDKVRTQLPQLPYENIIGEAVARNTAPCVAAAAQLIANRDPDGVMLVLPADHMIADVDSFRSVLNAAAEAAAEKEVLITIGIRPDSPETGYGYIDVDDSDCLQVQGHRICRVRSFTEKPDLNKAKQFLADGSYLWNSGMFIWKAKTILNAFEQHQEEISKKLELLQEDSVGQDRIDRFFKECPSISIDFGIMEKAESVNVIPADFGWNDVGSWKAVYQLSDKDSSGNAVSAGKILCEDAEGNLVHATGKRVVALVGVKNLAVIETDEAILVCEMDKDQKVRAIVDQLKGERSSKLKGES